MTIDFESEGLLDGLEGEAREARLRLLGKLEDDGATIEDLRAAVAEGRLALLPVERVLEGGGARFTIGEAAERSGLDEALVERLLRALGGVVPTGDAPTLTEGDVDAAERAARLVAAGMDPDQIVDISRVMGRAMAQVAAASQVGFGESLARDGDTEYDIAIRYAIAAEAILPLVGPAVAHALSVQQRAMLRQAVVDAGTLARGTVGSADMTIAFADLVGFTKLGERVETAELGAVAERLEEMATAVADPPVRLVKMIGDAAMLAAPDTDALLAAAFALAAAADEEAEGFPQLRVGMARGGAVSRGGDLFGRPVNLASRITGIARPGSVLAAESVKDAATEGTIDWSFAGERRMKGIADAVKLHRARPAAAPQRS